MTRYPDVAVDNKISLLHSTIEDICGTLLSFESM